MRRDINYLDQQKQREYELELKAHQYRVRSTKGSNYLDYESMRLLETVANFRQQAIKRNKTIQNKDITQRNQLNSKRLLKIQNIGAPRQSYRQFILCSAKREMQHVQQEKEIDKMNKIIKQRISRVESQFDQKQFIDDFARHKDRISKLTKFRQKKSHSQYMESENHSQQHTRQNTQGSQDIGKIEELKILLGQHAQSQESRKIKLYNIQENHY